MISVTDWETVKIALNLNVMLFRTSPPAVVGKECHRGQETRLARYHIWYTDYRSDVADICCLLLTQ